MAKLPEARMKACRTWPYGCHAVLSLVPVETPSLPFAMAVDAHWRLYYHPEKLADMSADEAAGTVLHEVSHLLLKHHARAARILPANATEADLMRWNYAADCAVNSNLLEEGVKLVEGATTPDTFGFEKGLTAEAYYRLLCDKEDQQNHQKGGEPDQQGKTSPGGEPDGETGQGGQEQGQGDVDGQPGNEPSDQTGDSAGGAGQSRQGDGEPSKMDGIPGGSCADGQPRPWELGEPSAEAPGMSQPEQEQIIREVAKKIEAKGRGMGSGGVRGWANEVLNPKIDPGAKLLRAVRRACEHTSGVGEYTYRRPNRRNTNPEVVRPSNVQPVPRITVVIDTSGSMDERDMGLGLGLVGKVLNSFRLRDGIRVLCGDTAVASAAKVFDPKKIELAGRGGTDVGLMLKAAADEKPRPELIVAVTDGITPWPSDRMSVPVVVCLTKPESECYPVPGWMEKVFLDSLTT